MNGHRCPGPGCATVIPRKLAMCKLHWFQVPTPLRDALWLAYRNLGPHGGISAATTDEQRQAHRLALRQAIEAIQ
jgi:hypothetical protein